MGVKDDVKALGIGAPLRAAYELSKRTVGHELVFGRLVPRGRAPSRVRLLPVPERVSADVAERTLAQARRICAGEVEVFGTAVDVGQVPNWHHAIHVDGVWPSDRWWKIDIRSAERLGDVKWCWEMARFRHVVLLARACWLAPDDRSFADALNRHVVSFLDQNPPEQGVHWYSNLELSLRAFAWLEVLSLADSALNPGVVDRIVAALHHTGRHLVADLPYTVSTMRNNHLLGDAVGLCALGYAFGEHRFGRRWTRIGDRLISRFLRTAARPRGTFIEDSVSYHRFVLELLSARMVLGDAPSAVGVALTEGAQFLCRLGSLAGPVPQYGDWDEGRVLVSADDPCSLVGSVLAGLSLGGGGALQEWLDRYDEVAWYCTLGAAVVPAEPEDAGNDIGGGVARLRRGELVVWLKAPAGTSHNHADATAVSVLADGHWLTGDPGTGTYNGPEIERNHFRSSAAHNVLRRGGVDQLEPHRAFRWKHRASGGFVAPVQTGTFTVMAAWHDAYCRLETPSLVLRVVLVADSGVAVADFQQVAAEGAISVPLSPGAVFSGSHIEMGHRLWRFAATGDSTSIAGSDEPFGGWWSTTYGERQPAELVEVSMPASSPVVWSIGDVGTFTCGDQSVRGDWGSVSVEWGHQRATLRVSSEASSTTVREVSW